MVPGGTFAALRMSAIFAKNPLVHQLDRERDHVSLGCPLRQAIVASPGRNRRLQVGDLPLGLRRYAQLDQPRFVVRLIGGRVARLGFIAHRGVPPSGRGVIVPCKSAKSFRDSDGGIHSGSPRSTDSRSSGFMASPIRASLRRYRTFSSASATHASHLLPRRSCGSPQRMHSPAARRRARTSFWYAASSYLTHQAPQSPPPPRARVRPRQAP